MKLVAYINGIGTAVPSRKVDQNETIKVSEALSHDSFSNQVLSKLVKKSAIETRYISAPICADGALDTNWAIEEGMGPLTSERMKIYQEVAPGLAFEASKKALITSKISNQEITHLITVTCTGFYAPGIDISLITELGLSPLISRVQIGFLGCHAAINAISVASAIVKADANAKVLLVAVEICSAHVSFREESLVPNIIFSDGSAALVISAVSLHENDLTIDCNHSFLVPHSQAAMKWSIGDHGFDMYLSPELPGIIEENVGFWILDTLKINPQDYLWAIHPGGIRVLQATQKALGIADDLLAPSKEVLRDFGNMSSPTVLFILEKLLLSRENQPICMIGFGPGLFCEGVILK